MITVIVTSHNISRFLPACLNSISSQTLPPNHVLVIDDCSIDDSVAVIERYIKDIKSAQGCHISTQWHLIAKDKNEGQSAAVNQGLVACKKFQGMDNNSFIALMDGDDIMMPERLARQALLLQQNPQIQFVAGSIQQFSERADNSWEISAPATRGVHNPQEAKAWAFFQSTAYTGMLMFRAWMTEEEDFLFRKSNGNDWEMVTRHSQRPLLWDQYITQWYRRHEKQITHRLFDSLETISTSIRQRELAKINIIPSEQEMWLHITISPCDFWRIEEIKYFWENKNYIVAMAEEWLQKIVKANAAAGYVEDMAMQYVCGHVLSMLKENVERYSLASPPPRYRF